MKRLQKGFTVLKTGQNTQKKVPKGCKKVLKRRQPLPKGGKKVSKRMTQCQKEVKKGQKGVKKG